MYTSVIFVFLFVSGSFGAHTSGTEHNDMRFMYEPDLRLFAMKLHVSSHHAFNKCLIYNMTSQEHSSIHTPDGLANVEEKVVNLIGSVSTATKMTHYEVAHQLNRRLGDFCTNYPTFFF